MLWNTLLLALRAIRRNLMRSFLTILGIVIGVAAVITMVTLGNGATKSVADQISSMGSNLLMVIPGQRFGPGSAAAPKFKSADVEAIRNQISGASLVAPVVNASATAVYQAQNWSTSIAGSNDDYFDAGSWELASGRIFSEAEQRSGKAVCVIGETVREKLFGRQNPLGAEIRIKQFSCEIVGLLKAKGQSAMGWDQDDTVVMPLRTVQRRLAGSQDINGLMISVRDGASIDKVKEQLALLMRERRNISETEDDDFRVMDTRQIAETLTGTTKILTMLLGAVAAVSLLVGGIGIMNIMLASVMERIKEIGIRLAIGARKRDVVLQFLSEATIISVIGGLIGIVLGVVLAKLITRLADILTIVAWDGVIISFVVSAAVGIIFGWMPARKAARQDPVESLRYE